MSTAVAVTRQRLPAAPTAAEWQMLREQAKVAIQSQLLPAHIKTEQQAIFIALKGHELSIPTTYALSNIAVINGKPTCQAELMVALVYRDHGDDALWVEESTNKLCTVSYKRRGWSKRRSYTFTIEDATRAGLTGGNWAKYPAAMLRARCLSAVCRMAFADSIAGMYVPEEMGAPVTVTSDGEVVLDSAALAASQATPQQAEGVITATFKEDGQGGQEEEQEVPLVDRVKLARAAAHKASGGERWSPKQTQQFILHYWDQKVANLNEVPEHHLEILLDVIEGRRFADPETKTISPLPGDDEDEEGLEYAEGEDEPETLEGRPLAYEEVTGGHPE